MRSILQTISGPIVLVGHSYGGAVITNAARGVPNVKALVYVGAVLIHGGAGGVGVYAVQLAASLGARVIATDLPQHAHLVRKLGADDFIDVTTQRFDELLSDIDVVLDTQGGTIHDRSYRVLRPGGRLITLVAPPSRQLADDHQVHAMFLIVQPDRAELQRLAAMVDAGELMPVIARTFPLADGRSAYESGRLPRPPGKTVLVVRGDAEAGAQPSSSPLSSAAI